MIWLMICLVIKNETDINFMSLKKCTAKPYSFFVIDTTPTSCNLLRFRKNLVVKIVNHDNWW